MKHFIVKREITDGVLVSDVDIYVVRAENPQEAITKVKNKNLEKDMDDINWKVKEITQDIMFVDSIHISTDTY